MMLKYALKGQLVKDGYTWYNTFLLYRDIELWVEDLPQELWLKVDINGYHITHYIREDAYSWFVLNWG